MDEACLRVEMNGSGKMSSTLVALKKSPQGEIFLIKWIGYFLQIF